jgi:hypothetical protein
MNNQEKTNSKSVSKEGNDNNKGIELDLSKLSASKSKSVSREVEESGVISIINAKTGKRIYISLSLMKNLNNAKKLQFAFNENSIVIGESLPKNNSEFHIKASGNKSNIYAAELVREITDRFSIDFNDRTSVTFHDVKYIQNEGNTIAIIKVS